MSDQRIDTVRRFNRFYTKRIGILEEGHLHSEFSLAEVRILYELANWPDAADRPPTASDIGALLGLDAGYLSRILREFERGGLITRTPSRSDARQHHLQLTDAGRSTFSELDARARDSIATLLSPLSDADQDRLVNAIGVINSLLGASSSDIADAMHSGADDEPPFALRHPTTSDLGWIVERHGTVFAREYGWNERFIALVARIIPEFIERRDPARERGWIAERNGERIGSVLLLAHREREGVAVLRLLLVEPAARGLGVGRRLVDECTQFARDAGYHTITLFTTSVLVSARRIYQAAGYKLVHEEPMNSWGPPLVAQNWELTL